MFKTFGKYQIQKKSSYKKTLLFTTVIGSVIGAGIALLASPTSGTQNRKMAAKYAKDKLLMIEEQAKKINSSLSTELQSEIEQISNIASKLTTSGKENLSNIADTLNQAIASFKNSLNKTSEVETINKIENLGKETVKNVAGNVEEALDKSKSKIEKK